jgi:hypothetical protein
LDTLPASDVADEELETPQDNSNEGEPMEERKWRNPKHPKFWVLIVAIVGVFGVNGYTLYQSVLGTTAKEIAQSQGLVSAWDKDDSCNVKAAKMVDLKDKLMSDCRNDISYDMFELMCRMDK